MTSAEKTLERLRSRRCVECGKPGQVSIVCSECSVRHFRERLGEPGWASTQAERDATDGTVIRREADDE